MNECAYIGLDVHKDTVAVAVALPGREEPVYRGEIKNQRKSLHRLIRSLSPDGEVLSFCYEAGPCGYGVYREIVETHRCEVVAPSLIPRRSGERVKTDRRDALKLARLHRAGLRAVWVPDEEQEAMRDLTRAREDLKAIENKARQRLGAFLLRHGRVGRARAGAAALSVAGGGSSSIRCSRWCSRNTSRPRPRPRPARVRRPRQPGGLRGGAALRDPHRPEAHHPGGNARDPAGHRRAGARAALRTGSVVPRAAAFVFGKRSSVAP